MTFGDMYATNQSESVAPSDVLSAVTSEGLSVAPPSVTGTRVPGPAVDDPDHAPSDTGCRICSEADYLGANTWPGV